MNRRRFLEWLGGAAIAPTFDIERLLWIPSAKTILVPSRPTVLKDREVGIAIRFIQQWDVSTVQYPTRMDAWMLPQWVMTDAETR